MTITTDVGMFMIKLHFNYFNTKITGVSTTVHVTSSSFTPHPFICSLSLTHDRNKSTFTNQMSTFSEHGSFLITSGAIHATVPAKDIFVLFSFHSRLVPKSDMRITSLWDISTLYKQAIWNNVTRDTTNRLTCERNLIYALFIWRIS